MRCARPLKNDQDYIPYVSTDMLRIIFKKLLRRPVTNLLAVFILGMHALYAWMGIPAIDSKMYLDGATEIKTTARWRYGFVRGYHGVFLVKTRNVARFAFPPTIENDNSFFFSTSQEEKDQVASAMRQRLEEFDRKFTLEALFYLAIFGYLYFGARRLRAWCAPAHAKPIRKILCDGFLWALGWTLVVLPLLFLNYGASMYTNWEGPGALSYSGPYLGLPTGASGETCTYRPYLEIFSILSILFLETTGISRILPETTIGFYILFSGILFYGLIGVLIGVVREWIFTVTPADYRTGVTAAGTRPQSDLRH